MVISEQYDLKDYTKPLHEVDEDQMRRWAAKAEELLNAEGSGNYKLDVRVSQRGTHIYVDAKKNNFSDVTIEPAMMGKEIKSCEDVVNAIKEEFISRERSQAYVRGEITGEVFADKYRPEGLEEEYHPTINPDDYAEEGIEEDRAC